MLSGSTDTTLITIVVVLESVDGFSSKLFSRATICIISSLGCNDSGVARFRPSSVSVSSRLSGACRECK